MSAPKQPKPVKAWAWAIDMGRGYELCFWSMPSRKQLDDEGKPSPEARMIRVEIRPVPKRRKSKKGKR